MSSPDSLGFLGAVFGDRSAADYDETITALRPTASIVTFLVDRLLPADRVVEVGAGTGAVAEGLARQSNGVVVGTDVSPRMLEVMARRGAPNLEALEHDIVAGPLPGTADGAYCIFNTLFMLGPLHRQATALGNIRQGMAPGGRLVVEVFQPNDETYEQDGMHLEPQHLDAESLRLTASHVRAADRVVEMQNLVIRNGSITLTPSSFHFCTVEELDAMAEGAGWSLTERYSGWQGTAFTTASMNAVSVYTAS